MDIACHLLDPFADGQHMLLAYVSGASLLLCCRKHAVWLFLCSRRVAKDAHVQY